MKKWNCSAKCCGVSAALVAKCVQRRHSEKRPGRRDSHRIRGRNQPNPKARCLQEPPRPQRKGLVTRNRTTAQSHLLRSRLLDQLKTLGRWIPNSTRGLAGVSLKWRRSARVHGKGC